MEYVVLDTCVLVNCTLVNAVGADPELLVTIFDKMRDRGALLLLPEVIESEYRRKVPEELGLIRAQSKKFRHAITTEALPAPDVSELHMTLDRLDSAREESVTRAQEYFAAAADDPTLTVRVPLTGDIIAAGVGRALAGRKPWGSGAHDLVDPDSLVIASIAAFARENGLSEGDVVLLCSDNHKDFGVWSDAADRHVIAEDIAESIPCEIRYYKSPRSLVEDELEVVVEAGEPLAAALDSYDQMSETLASVSATAAWTDYFARIQDAITPIDPEILERLRRACAIDPKVLERLRRAVAIDPEVLERLRRAVAIDPEILQRFKRAGIGSDPEADSDPGPEGSRDVEPEDERGDEDDSYGGGE